MMNDTVREELQPKVTTSGNLPSIEQSAVKPSPHPFVQKANPYAVPPPALAAPTPSIAVSRTASPATAVAPAKRVETAGLTVSKTSPTLVEFQAKNTSIPEWRLQMQNAVRQRKGTPAVDDESTHAVSAAPSIANRAKVPSPAAVQHDVPENADPRLNNALRRIADSRSSFLPEESPKTAFAPRETPARNFRFDVVEPRPGSTARPTQPQAAVNLPPKPTLVVQAKIEKLDTNKLPKLDEVYSKKIEKVEEISKIEQTPSGPAPPEFEGIKRIFINAEHVDQEKETDLIETDEIEDLAPFPMRFNAGLFDLIIGSVVTMALLSPLALSGGEWFSLSGLLIFAAALSIVMFVYLTACVGFYGKTLGMRIFSLEIVDAEENEYPTIQQAAVHSSIYLVSLVFGGIGFITVLFNEERRAVHDLLSGTIIVREF